MGSAVAHHLDVLCTHVCVFNRQRKKKTVQMQMYPFTALYTIQHTKNKKVKTFDYICAHVRTYVCIRTIRYPFGFIIYVNLTQLFSPCTQFLAISCKNRCTIVQKKKTTTWMYRLICFFAVAVIVVFIFSVRSCSVIAHGFPSQSISV